MCQCVSPKSQGGEQLPVSYACAHAIERNIRPRLSLAFAITFLIGLLIYFKYMNFFIGAFQDMLGMIGYTPNRLTLDIVLPIGISFHTFQALAYLIDVRRGTIRAEPDFIRFAAFSMFFPQLVAGPIERASHLLTQFQQPRTVDSAKVRQAVWLITLGIFFKIGIADMLAHMTEIGFSDKATAFSGWWVILGSLSFTLQIYGDFMGYSVIAKGVALLMGFDLSWNFLFPYWSRSVSEFWQRWHITLGLWLRDYLYIPLGGNRCSMPRASVNLLTVMLLGGLWHGANWTFLLWGAWHGGALACYHALLKDRLPPGRFRTVTGWLATMLVVVFGWVLFRVTSLAQLHKMAEALRFWAWYPAHTDTLVVLAFVTAVLAVMEWHQRRAPNHDLSAIVPPPLKALVLGGAIVFSAVMSMHTRVNFIYFQF